MAFKPRHQMAGLLCIILFYALLYSHSWQWHLESDFATFYNALLNFKHRINPYESVLVQYFAQTKKHTLLNPPFFVWLLQPFAEISYTRALIIWSIINLAACIIGAMLVFTLVFDRLILKKYIALLFVMFFSMFPVIINSTIGQTGGPLLLCLMSGYFFYLKKQDLPAALFWGFITALKIFPGLLVFFALKQQRYKLAGFLVTATLLFSALPIFCGHFSLFENYFTLIPKIHWYGDNWNASLYGFLSRFFSDPLLPIFYVIVFIALLSMFYISMKPGNNPQSFSLCLVMMLILSPLGWIYYFPLLLMPLIVSWQSIQNSEEAAFWSIMFVLLNTPMGQIKNPSLSFNLGLGSMYFYGLCLLAWILGQARQPDIRLEKPPFVFKTMVSVLLLDVSFVLVALVWHLKDRV